MANTTFTGPVRSENGFESITKNTTTGAITVGATYGATINGGVQSLTSDAGAGIGAVDLTNLVTELTTTDALGAPLTLANGSAGQVKIITMVVDGGDGILTPTTFASGTTITFNDVGDGVILVYGTAGWVVVGNNGATIA
jgi:hypothetical protein